MRRKDVLILIGLVGCSFLVANSDSTHRRTRRITWDSRGGGGGGGAGGEWLWPFSGERRSSRPTKHKENVDLQKVFAGEKSSRPREKKLLSLFTVVKFDNDLCTDTSGENGTCLSAVQCSQRRGTPSGICANGYGVCCTVTATCGQSTSDNNTYFVNSNYPSSSDGTESCQLTLLKAHPDVCQFRLDFVRFNLRGPETTNHVCAFDQFIVSGTSPVPPICGVNDGNHMYIDAGVGQTNPVILTVVTSGTSFARSWKIRVSQIPCSTIYRAEEGCLQYHTGVSGQIKSFNYNANNGLQLSNQDYGICVRTERNFCGIQYTSCLDEAPSTANNNNNNNNNNDPRQQGSRSNAFTLTGNSRATQISSMSGIACQTDWLMIPCASNLGTIASAGGIRCVDRLCGGTLNAEAQNLNSSTVVSTIKPFRLIFHTDGTEAPNDSGNAGFCLNYVQQPCT